MQCTLPPQPTCIASISLKRDFIISYRKLYTFAITSARSLMLKLNENCFLFSKRIICNNTIICCCFQMMIILGSIIGIIVIIIIGELSALCCSQCCTIDVLLRFAWWVRAIYFFIAEYSKECFLHWSNLKMTCSSWLRKIGWALIPENDFK